MSIIDSRPDREAAVERLTGVSDADLERDLIHWTIAAHKSSIEYLRLAEAVAQIRELHAEEEAWTGLIAGEIVKRRAALAKGER